MPPLPTPDPAQRLRQEALRLLTRRDYSRAQISDKLSARCDSPELLAQTLDALEAQHLLSDTRYAQQRVTSRASRYGNARLAQELRRDGLNDADINTALADSADETSRCRAVWAKKFTELPHTAADRARQMRFLQYRGFSGDAIRQVLRGDDEE